jgi:hypothetical protein
MWLAAFLARRAADPGVSAMTSMPEGAQEEARRHGRNGG